MSLQSHSWTRCLTCPAVYLFDTSRRLEERMRYWQTSDLRNVGACTVHGVLRNMAFRISGRSVTLHKDFVVTDMLDGLVDVVFGWKFMASEFGVLFDKVFNMFSEGFTDIKVVVSGFSKKVAKVSSVVRRRVSDCMSRALSPSPPYSLCDVRAPNPYL
jgi:hypothetical protein